MQGRLSPPVDGRIQAFPAGRWRDELASARAAGVSGVEWIYEVAREEYNPLGDDAGVVEVRAACVEHGVTLESLVADWFMDRPLLEDPSPRAEKLRSLAARAAAAGIRRIVVPFVDASSLGGPGGAERLAPVIRDVADAVDVELHLETDLAPGDFARLLERVDHPRVLANYDTGNSAALGYDPHEELAAYGDRIGSVHLKDRVRGGGSVTLGDGDADLPAVFSLLRARGWSRPLVLQVARGVPGDEVAKTAHDAERVRRLWDEAAP
jgi:hexulose-6-phosphate isomerase